MLLHLWHPTAWRFGRCKFCSGDPGRASTACLIKSKVLNRDIYTACHQAHGWAVWARLYKLLENFCSNSGQSPGSFSPGLQNGQPQPPLVPAQMHTEAWLAWVSWKRSPAPWWGDSWRVPGALSLANGWLKSSSRCRSGQRAQVQLAGGLIQRRWCTAAAGWACSP